MAVTGGGVGSWPVWRLPRPMIVVLVGVVLGAVSLIVGGLMVLPADPPAGEVAFGVIGLIALGVLHTELASGIERSRKSGTTWYFDLSTVWTFAAALLLPPAAAGLVVLGIYSHMWWRVWRPAGAEFHRHVYTTATVVLAAGASAALVTPAQLTVAAGVGPGSALAGYGRLLLSMLVYVLINQALIALALTLATGARFSWRGALGDWGDHVLEGATLCLAVLAALAATRHVLLVLLVLPPLLVLHRAVLLRQVEEQANTDVKTGLLTAAAWRVQAHRLLTRARRQESAAAVLILDLDHFKAVNDGYGHLAGDEVLVALADVLRTQVRDADAVGRFGGEEFIVLLAGLPPGEEARALAHAAGERIRRTVRSLAVHVEIPDGELTISDLSVSVGVAISGPDRDSLDELMQVADLALYAAKRAGRNRVRLGRAGVDPGPEA